jgi:hypothetical protein
MGRLEQAVYDTLSSSGKALPLKQIYPGVKERLPDRCDDSISPCPYCKQKHPKWKHDVNWALQKLKHQNLVRRARRGYWQVAKTPAQTSESVSPIPTEVRPPPESPHERLKLEIKEIGEVLGKKCNLEFCLDNYEYDVVWKEIEGLLPSHVFEIQDKGNVDLALSKLQHAQHKWRPTGGLFLVVTEEKDRNKVEALLKPHLEGTFHKIANKILVLMPEVVDQIHTTMMAHAGVIRRLIEE